MTHQGTRLAVASFLVASALAVTPAWANTHDQYCPPDYGPCAYSFLAVIDDLDAMGYTIANVRNTLLNRIQITAQRPGELRELVIRKSDGSVLLDRVTTEVDPFYNDSWTMW